MTSGAPAGTLRLAARLARRELRGGTRGLRIFWLCLTLGVGIIAGVGSVAQSIMHGLAADARALLGGDVTLRVNHREISPDARRYLDSAGTVSAVTHLRTMVRTPDNRARRLAELKGVDAAYPLYGRVRLTPEAPLATALGRETDGTWGLAADQRLLDALAVTLGQMVRIGEATYRIRALLVEEPDRTGRSLLFGGTVLVARGSLPATQLVQPGSLVTYEYRLRLPDGVDTAQWVAELERAFPDADWRVRTPATTTPRVQRFVENLGDFFQLVGLTALLVGGTGVSNAVFSYLESKRRTIATLKCLGCPGVVIFQTYLLQTLVLASVGVACGLLLGAIAPILVGPLLANVLPVPPRFGVYPGPLLVAAAYGFLTALAFSLWPLGQVREVRAGSLFRSLVDPPHRRPGARILVVIAANASALAGLALLTTGDRAQACWFIVGAAVTFAAFYGAGRAVVIAVRRLGRPRRPFLRLALANLSRVGAPTVSVVVSLGLGVTALVAIALVQGNLARQVNEAIPQTAPSYFFIDIQPGQVAEFEALVEALPGETQLERVPMLRGRITEIAGVPVEEATIGEGSAWAVEGDRQLTWAATPPGDGAVIAGAWWAPAYRGPPVISLEADIARDFGVGVGDSLTFNILGRLFKAEIVNVRRVNWESMGINFAVVFSPGVLDGAPHSHMATVKMPAELEAPLERAVSDRFPNISAIRIKEVVDTVNTLLRQIGVAVRAVAGVAILSGILVLAGAVAAEHRRRVYSAVILKVLGATRLDIVRAYGLEHGLLGLLTLCIAAALGTGVSFAVSRWTMHIPWRFLPQTLVVTALGAVGLTLAAGFIGTWQALGHPAARTLRNE